MGLNTEIAGLGEAAGWANLDAETSSLTETSRDPRFPGAVVPARSPSGAVIFYGLAPDGPTWRRLQPLLLAFAGPTVTDFEGQPADLDRDDPVEGRLLHAGLHAVARLRPEPSQDGSSLARRALVRLHATLARAPDLAGVQPQPTSRLLANLQDALNSRDLGEAWRLHEILRTELRLDAANLVQLEIAIYAAVRDWSAIRWHPRFEVLCASMPPAAVAEILLEALYWTELNTTGAGENPAAVRELFASRVRPYAEMLLPVVPQTTNAQVERVRELIESEREATTAVPDEGLTRAKNSDQETSHDLRKVGASSLEIARGALLAVAQTPDSSDRLSCAAAAMEALSDEERDHLLSTAWFRALWVEVESRLGRTRPPSGWRDWLNALADLSFDATIYARRAAADWRPPDAEIDPTAGAALAQAIEAAPDGVCEDRLLEALPYWIAWAKADPRWARTAYRPVYSALLLRIALCARRGEPILRSTAALLEGLLQVGLTAAEYRETVEAVETIVIEGINRNSIYDILELLDLLQEFNVADRNVIDSFFARVLPAVQALQERLTPGQRAGVDRVIRGAGWQTSAVLPSSPADSDIAVDLRGERIGIYTLTESAGRQARAILAEIAPDAVVELNHDHVGTKALQTLATGADIFVIAWASAKHAATEFIRDRRGTKPLLYAGGRGASSIVRALEDFSFSRGV